MNPELADVQAGFRKVRGTRDPNANNLGSLKKQEDSRKLKTTNKQTKQQQQTHTYFCFIDYAKAFDCADHYKLWKILKEMEIPDNLTCLWRNLYASQEATIRNGHGTTDWLQIEGGGRQGCILPPCLFEMNTEYIMRHSGVEEAEAGVQIARRNINNLRYADNTTLMAENEEEV